MRAGRAGGYGKDTLRPRRGQTFPTNFSRNSPSALAFVAWGRGREAPRRISCHLPQACSPPAASVAFFVAKCRDRAPVDATGERAVWKNRGLCVPAMLEECDLLHDQRSPGGSEFSTLLSEAWAQPALGVHDRTRVSEQVASIKGQGNRGGRAVSQKGTVTFLPSEHRQGKGPVRFCCGHSEFVKTCGN